MKRKFLALFLVLTLAAFLFPASAFAAPGVRDLKQYVAAKVQAAEEDAEEALAEEEAPAEENVPEEDQAVSLTDDGAPMPPKDMTPEELAAAAALAGQIQSDGAVIGINPDTVIIKPEGAVLPALNSDSVTVAAGETAYAYEGMTVFNNGGTVYSNLATVFNNGGTVYANGGKVYNNAGIVYSNIGTVYNNAGEVYNNGAEIYSFSEDAIVSSSRVYSYYELKFAGYYEPYILVDGITTEPGSEKMIVSENTACHISPYPGYVLKAAETDSGDLVWDSEDGSLFLTNVNADTTLTLTLQADAPVFSLESGSYVTAQDVSISGPAGCEIFYSLDGSIPDAENGTRYENALSVSENTVITAVAVVDGVESSEPAQLTLSFLSFSTPAFADEAEGYYRPLAQAIVVTNPGTEAVMITGVTLEGEDPDAFALSTETGKAVPAGGVNDTKWTIRPVKGLSAGDYEASAVFTLESGETVEVPLHFSVLPNGTTASDADMTEVEPVPEALPEDAEMPSAEDAAPNAPQAET